eukprot:28238-Chlamydomonas_euryale.AAC.2
MLETSSKLKRNPSAVTSPTSRPALPSERCAAQAQGVGAHSAPPLNTHLQAGAVERGRVAEHRPQQLRRIQVLQRRRRAVATVAAARRRQLVGRRDCSQRPRYHLTALWQRHHAVENAVAQRGISLGGRAVVVDSWRAGWRCLHPIQSSCMRKIGFRV